MPLFSLLQIVAATIAGAALPGDAPIRLVCTPLPDAVRVQIIGSADRSYEADYELEVNTDPSAGGNRSLNRGHVRLEPNVSVVLATITVSSKGAAGWKAKLRVKPEGAPAYEEIRSSS